MLTTNIRLNYKLAIKLAALICLFPLLTYVPFSMSDMANYFWVGLRMSFSESYFDFFSMFMFPEYEHGSLVLLIFFFSEYASLNMFISFREG